MDYCKLEKEKKISKRRLSLYPIKDLEVFEKYKKAQACYWTAEELDLVTDKKQFNNLKPNEKEFLKKILAFFNASDIIVNENMSANWLNEEEFNSPEISNFLWFQGMIECVHSECYSLLIDTYIDNKEEKDTLFNAVEKIPSVRKKAEWVYKYMNENIPLIKRVFAFVLVEGLQFSGSFCSIFWFKKRGLLPGLSFANQLIARDEGLHADFSSLLFKRLQDKNDKKFNQEKAYELVKECVEIEIEFVCDSLRVDLIGMNKKLMAQYIKYIADYWLKHCGFEPLYRVKQPFEWMETISLQGKTNFFEARVSEYQKSGVGNTREEREFSIDCDF
jgi:ribonucleotide reductase beta subunit family protein with ferritin-like domain